MLARLTMEPFIVPQRKQPEVHGREAPQDQEQDPGQQHSMTIHPMPLSSRHLSLQPTLLSSDLGLGFDVPRDHFCIARRSWSWCCKNGLVVSLIILSIDVKKSLLRFSYFGHVLFTFLTFFYFPNVFLFKKTLAKFRAARRLTRNTLKIIVTK